MGGKKGPARSKVSVIMVGVLLVLGLAPTVTMSSSDKVAAGGGEKTSWPEVVGLCVEEAKAIILRDKPNADIVVLPVGTMVTMDYRPERVRVFVDTVAGTPHVG